MRARTTALTIIVMTEVFRRFLEELMREQARLLVLRTAPTVARKLSQGAVAGATLVFLMLVSATPVLPTASQDYA